MTNLTIRLLFLALIISFAGCQPEKKGKSKKQGDQTDITADSVSNSRSRQVAKIFYNVPSPLEMTRLIQKAGSHYDKDLLNPLSNRTHYTTNEKMALNLGVYGADLSYARIFDQIQISIEYLTQIKKLTEKMGIPEEDGGFTVSRLQDNMENRDTLLQIIAETYSSTDSYLKENDRESTAVLVLAGGWVEAIYLATSIVDLDKPNIEILNRIAEQKFSLSNLIELMKGYEEDESVVYYRKKMEELYDAFGGIEISYQLNDVLTDEENKLTTIDSDTEIKVSVEDIKKIHNIVIGIRKEIIK